MAITQRTGPHDSWIVVGGQSYQCLDGVVELSSLGEPGKITCRVPLNAPGYMEGLAGVGKVQCKVTVETADGQDDLAQGLIEKIDFDLIGGIITIHAKDASAQLHHYKSHQSFTNKMGHEIVQEVVSPFMPVVASGSTVMAGKKFKDDYVKLTDGQSVFSLVNKLSQMDGTRWWTDKQGVFNYQAMEGGTLGGGSTTLLWKKPGPGSPMVSDCLALQVIHKVEIADATAESSTWRPYDKVTGTTGTSAGAAAPASGGGGGPTASGGGALTWKLDSPNQQEQQNQQSATKAGDFLAQHEWQVYATIVGDPSITADMQITLSGSGVFDRSYQIDKIIHRFGYSGFTTTINSRGGKD